MPICNFFQCTKGHITDKIHASFEESQEKQRCHKPLNKEGKVKRCRAFASIVYMSNRAGQNALAFKPIEFFLNPKSGEVLNIGCSLRDIPKLPNKAQKKLKAYISKLEKKGFSHRELSNRAEYETFRKSQNSTLTQKNLQEVLGLEAESDQWIKQEIDDLRRGFMLKYPDGRSVSIPPLDKFDHPEVAKLAKDLIENRPIDLSLLEGMDSRLAQELIEINNHQGRSAMQQAEAGFYVDAMENNQGKRSSWI